MAMGCQCGQAKLTSRYGELVVVTNVGAANELVSRDATYDFGGVALGQTKPLELVVRNLGSAPLQLTELRFVTGAPTAIGTTRADAVFSVSFADATVAPGMELRFPMEFSPRDRANLSAELILKAEGGQPEAGSARIVLRGSLAGCGNGVVDPQETCDLPASCPQSCSDADACTTDTLVGSAAACTAACEFKPVTSCLDGDGCCPRACTAATDDDCLGCGNGKVEAQETCDPPGSCPASCSDGNACTADVMTGSAASCDVACSNTPISECRSQDGCCPAGCTGLTDSDCRGCGNLVIDAAETCDPPSSCPTSCADNNACTTDVLTGSANACTAACRFSPISSCLSGDGCCASGCSALTDADCAGCGNGRLEAGETCDPPGSCPVSCSDGNACTADTLSGSALSCNVSCSHAAITMCRSGDGCCPSGCSGLNDTDCTGCGNSVCDAPQETCENCVSDCGTGYAVSTPNASCSGPMRLATFGRWCSTELIIVDTLTPLSSGIEVEVRRNRPFVLALVARDSAQWVVRLMPGHQLQRIVASGPSTQVVTFQGGSVPVTTYDTPSTWFGCGDVGDLSCDAVEQRRRAAAAANTPVTMYLGCPGMSVTTIN